MVDRDLLDVMKQCLNRDMNGRAHIVDLLGHPFLKGRGGKRGGGGKEEKKEETGRKEEKKERS